MEYDKDYKAAGLLVYSIVENEPSILMVMEVRGKVLGLSFPGGKRESYDETPIHTAVREFMEETRKVIPLSELAVDSVIVPYGKFYLANAWTSNWCDLGSKFFNAKYVDDTTIYPTWVPIKKLLFLSRPRVVDPQFPLHEFTKRLIVNKIIRDAIKILQERCEWIATKR